ncbi:MULTISPECIES: hypothetical protein [Clostridium]|uniref:hypothetical protein n=1 Tax=Clostridium TaxID=1485 RepID=UPI0018977973|nr:MULTISPECIES: hypothetical protein [Clostridium]MCR1952651.1 hypothetical protein [Clostridium sp. DSM 100503]MDI9215463.1 hypothetical protein [Clostridium tertium]
MKKIIILLLLVISTFYSCSNKKIYNKAESNISDKSEDKQRTVNDNDDTVILKASFKEKSVNIEDLIKKVEEDLSSEGALAVAVDREGDSIYIMTTKSEAKDIRIHKINASKGLNSSDYIKDQRDINYEKISDSIKEGEYLIVPIKTESEFTEEAISWISNDGKVKVYETKGEKSSEINIFN